VPPQNPVDRTTVDVSTLGVKLTYPDASVAVRPFRNRPIQPRAAARARSRKPRFATAAGHSEATDNVLRNDNHSLTKFDADGAIVVYAYFGSKLRALLVGFLPFGTHIPWGKRLHIRVTIRGEGGGTRVSIKITPFMELFDTSEVLLMTQSPAEKASDEYLAAVHLRSITRSLQEATKTSPTDDLSELDNGTFAADFLTGLMLYAFEGDATERVVHIPPSPGTSWSWQALLVPEIWFVWNEIWGVSLLMVVLDWALFKLVMAFPVPTAFIVAGVLFIAFRLVAARMAHSIFYARYGRWPSEVER
jgi:hypothetical protein